VDESLTLQLERFDDHGSTRARHDGRWIKVEHGIPGETVVALPTGSRGTRAHIVEVLKSSLDRIEPPCVYFRDWACGGCQWQHIGEQSQVERKTVIVDDIMRSAGFDVSISAVHRAPSSWRYRSNAGISLGKSAGFRRHGSLAIVPIQDCVISHPLIGRLMVQLNESLSTGRLPDFRGRLRLDVQVVGEVASLQVLVRAVEREVLPAREQLDPLFSFLMSHREVFSVGVEEANGSISPVSGRLLGDVSVAKKKVAVATGAFFQTNVDMLGVLIERLRQELQPKWCNLLIDGYGGVGIFGVFLADLAKKVFIVESNERAIAAGRRTSSQWGLSNTTFLQARIEDVSSELADADVVIVDPPRAGLAPGLVTQLAKTPVKKILYVSCLAQSLARDLKALVAGGYMVESLELFDFYPQTYHVELLAILGCKP
jgi:23S rRNA (uracil1939-C5)-methyltransferase